MDGNKCDGCGNNLTLTSFCVQCSQCYCAACTTVHTRQGATNEHILLRVSPEATETSSTKIGVNCKICDSKKEVVSLCACCRELYCEDCTNRHRRQNATRDHQLAVLRLRDPSQSIRPIERTVTAAKNYAQVQVQAKQNEDANLYKGALFIEKTCSAPGETEMTRIRGMVILADGRLVIIDGKNKCMKIFKPDWYDLVSKKDLTDEPRGISFIAQEDVAITFADKKEIRIYKIDKANNLWKQRTFGIKDKPFSISYSKKSFAIELGEGDDGVIALTDFNGNITHLVRGHNSNFGQFTGNTIRLIHDNEKKIIFVVNVSDGYIHCVNYEGDIRWFIEINTPRGVALHENTLFVASKIDNKVYQVNTTNGNLNNLISERVSQPRYIAFQAMKEKLVVEVGANVNIYNVSKRLATTR